MREKQFGFTLIELIAVITLLGVLSVVLFSRISSVNASRVQASRDDVIAALFFAQQLSMSRSNVQVVISSGAVDVTQNGTSIKLGSSFYPLAMPSGVLLSATSSPLSFDKLGRTSSNTIHIQTNDGSFATDVNVETTGYAH